MEVFGVERKEEYASWSVQVGPAEDGRKYWIDIWLIREYDDVGYDWNQYIFQLKNEDDVERKAFQDDCYNFDEVASIAIEFLEEIGEFKQKENGEWFCPVAEDDWFEGVLCMWCKEFYSDTDVQYEVDLGYLCDHCVMAIRSRGEKLTFQDQSKYY